MSFSKGLSVGPSSIEDVPFKVGEQCQPPKKVTMPLNFEMGNPAEALYMEYDFSVEENFLQWVEVQKRLRNEAAAVSKARADATAKAASEAAAAAKELDAEKVKQDAANTAIQSTSQSTSQKPKSSATPYFANISNGGILVPTVLSPPVKKDNAQPSTANQSTFDLADFEQAQDPFESMELKVLDDMAELNKVLQRTVVAESPKSNKAAVNSDTPSERTPPPVPPRPLHTLPQQSQTLKDVDYPDIDSISSTDSAVSLTTGGTGLAAYHKPMSGSPKLPSLLQDPASNPMKRLQSLPPIPTMSSLVQQPVSSLYTTSTQAVVPQQTYAAPSPFHSTQASTTTQGHVNNSMTGAAGSYMNHQYNRNTNNGMHVNLNDMKPQSMNPFNPFANQAINGSYSSSPASSTSTTGLKRSARSTPDIPGLLGEKDQAADVKRPLSHTPPPCPSKSSPRQYTDKQDWNHYRHLPRTPPSRPSASASPPPPPKPSRPAPSLPDPFRGMSHEAQMFVNTIADMGFQRARVARTVEKLGQDDKKVIDHLCAINRLEERGFSPVLAETALQLFENNDEKAKQYLTLQKQFVEFGFKEEKVQDALIKNNLDEDKTLDCLTAT